jgi:hypothetical protein
MKVGDLVVVELTTGPRKGFVTKYYFDDEGCPWIEVCFLNGEKDEFDWDNFDWTVISESG